MEENRLTKKYQCNTCGGITEFNIDHPEEKMRCLCGSKDLFLQSVEFPPDYDVQVELYEAYEALIAIYRDYMDIDEDAIKIIALWTLSTYFHEQFNTFPYLFLNATKSSGKTRLLKLISTLSYKGTGSVDIGITESSLFHMPPGVPLILDECEHIGSKEKGVLREYLNACYKKNGCVHRMKKVTKKGEENYVREVFYPYKPIAMANINGFDEVLEDRAVKLVLEKSNSYKTKVQEDYESNEGIKALKVRLMRISVMMACHVAKRTYPPFIIHDISTLTTLTTLNDISTLNNTNNNTNNNTKFYDLFNTTTWNNYIRAKYSDKKEEIKEEENTAAFIYLEEFFEKIDKKGITGRNLEIIFPLLATALKISTVVFDEVLEILAKTIEQKKEEDFTESKDMALYEYVVMHGEPGKFVSLKDFTYHFKLFQGESEEINEKWMGIALKRLNLVLMKKRLTNGRQVILNIDKAKEKLKMFKKD